MTENLIKDVKKIQQALINKESVGDEFEEKMEAIHKLEEVADYLKDALGRVKKIVWYIISTNK